MTRWESSETDSAKPVGAWAGVSAIDAQGRTIWIVDAHRGDGRHFIVRADEILSAFVELERQVLTVTFLSRIDPMTVIGIKPHGSSPACPLPFPQQKDSDYKVGI